MRQFLFLTDFSEIAENAYIYALNIAKAADAQLNILHIVPVIPPEDAEEEFAVHPFARMVNKNIESKSWGMFRDEAKTLEQIAKDHDFMDVPVEFHFREGRFTDVVEEVIEEKSATLVVVGTAGNNSFEKKLFGSNTENLLQEIDIPILAIPASAKYSVLRKFAAGVLLSDAEIETVNYLAARTAEMGTELHCVHIAKDAAEAAKAEQQAKVWLQKTPHPNLSLDIRIDEDAEKGLMDFVAEKDIDTLCIIHRELSFFDRLFRKNYCSSLLNHSSTAILIFKRSPNL